MVVFVRTADETTAVLAAKQGCAQPNAATFLDVAPPDETLEGGKGVAGEKMALRKTSLRQSTPVSRRPKRPSMMW